MAPLGLWKVVRMQYLAKTRFGYGRRSDYTNMPEMMPRKVHDTNADMLMTECLPLNRLQVFRTVKVVLCKFECQQA